MITGRDMDLAQTIDTFVSIMRISTFHVQSFLNSEIKGSNMRVDNYLDSAYVVIST